MCRLRLKMKLATAGPPSKVRSQPLFWTFLVAGGPWQKMSGQIFISYRREDSRWLAGRLFDRLAARFDRKQIFMDIDTVALGEDFVKAIENTVGNCDLLIAVIGAHWLTSKDGKGGRRLDNPEDFVRMEIATALRRDIRVIPVLVDGALMPPSIDLPDDLKQLVRRNALQVGETHFDDDCRRLLAAIEQVLEKPPISSTPDRDAIIRALWNRLLRAEPNNADEIRRIGYDVDEFLQQYPNDPDARELRHRVNLAQTRMEQFEMHPARPSQSRRKRFNVPVRILATSVLILIVTAFWHGIYLPSKTRRYKLL